jgi:hypothetical protein
MHYSSGIVLPRFNNLVQLKDLYEVAAIASPGACGGPRTGINKIAVSRLGVISGQWLTSSHGRHKGGSAEKVDNGIINK